MPNPSDPVWTVEADTSAEPVTVEELDSAVCDLLAWLAETATPRFEALTPAAGRPRRAGTTVS